MKQTTASIRELKDHLSAYLRRMRAGETVTITESGAPIGRLVPAEEQSERTLEEKMQALQEAGVLKWSGKRLPPHEPTAKVKGNKMVSDMLLEDRR